MTIAEESSVPYASGWSGKVGRPLLQELSGGLFLRRRPAAGAARGALLWIHGLGESGLCFETVSGHPRLASWDHLLLDLPGYGKSPWRVSEPLSLEEQAVAVLEWLAAREEGPVGLIGHSMGGVIGQRLCERGSGRIRAFLNVEGNISYDDCTGSRTAAAYGREDFLRHGMASFLEDLYRDGIEDPILRSYYASARICDPAAFYRNSVELVEQSRAEGLAGRLGALGMPVLYLAGDPGGAGKRSRQLLEQAAVAWAPIAPAGHWPFLDQPQRFARTAADFFDFHWIQKQ